MEKIYIYGPYEIVTSAKEANLVIITKPSETAINVAKADLVLGTKTLEIKDYVEMFLYKCRVPKHVEGFKYISEIIIKSYLYEILGSKKIRIYKIYKEVSDEFNENNKTEKKEISAYNVERNIRNLIQITMSPDNPKYGDKEFLKSLFPYYDTIKKCTNTEFIAAAKKWCIDNMK